MPSHQEDADSAPQRVPWGPQFLDDGACLPCRLEPSHPRGYMSIDESQRCLTAIVRPDKHLSLLTFNAGLLDYRLLGIPFYQNPPYVSSRLKELPNALRRGDTDIVCLQELYVGWHTRFITESLKDLYPYAAHNQRRHLVALSSGLLVLSKYPIVSSTFHPFSLVTPLERLFANKGCLEVVIDIVGLGRVAVFNFHLASGALNPESEAIENVRNQEIADMLALTSAAAGRGQIPLLIGDLNAAPDLSMSNYKNIIAAGWRDAWAMAHADDEVYLQELQGRRALAAHSHFLKGLSMRNWWRRRPGKLTPDEESSAAGGRQMDGHPPMGYLDETEEVSQSGLDLNLDLRDRNQPVTAQDNPPEIPQLHTAKSAVSRFKNAFNWELPNPLKLLSMYHPDGDDGPDGPEKHRADFTWDPLNPLNATGPHAGCHGLRCDYVFLPPRNLSGRLEAFLPTRGDIVFKRPSVTVWGWGFRPREEYPPRRMRFPNEAQPSFESEDETTACCKCTSFMSRTSINVTQSDHYGLRVLLKRVDAPLDVSQSPIADSIVAFCTAVHSFCTSVGSPGAAMGGI